MVILRSTARVLLLASVILAMGGAAVMASEQAATQSLSLSEQLKHPAPWVSVGFDQRLRDIYQKNVFWLDNDSSAPENEWHFQRFRSRLWANFTPAEDIEINTRLVWEWRNYCKPDDDDRSGPINWDEALFDTMNIKLKNFAGIEGTSLTIGRQDIILGNGWLVLDGTPQDGSRTIFFDAVRLSTQLDPATTADIIYIDQCAAADDRIKPFNSQERWGPQPGSLAEQDERGAIVYLTNSEWIPNAQTSPYFIYKKDMSVEFEGANCGNDSDMYAFGARVAGNMNEDWKYRAEFAQELGRKNGDTLCAFGFNSCLTYMLHDPKSSEVHAGYEFLSGDDPDTGTNEAFDPLWGRWPQWSELLVYTYATETRIAEVTNLHRINVGHKFKPTENTELLTDYHLLFADEKTQKNSATADVTDHGYFRGQLVTCKLNYKINEQWSGHLLGELFFPGNFYNNDRNDVATMLRYELTFRF